MARRRQLLPGLPPEEAARLEHAIDRLEDRLMSAPPGLHRPGDRATQDDCIAAGLPRSAVLLWMRYDGVEVGAEMARLLPLAEIPDATANAANEGLIHDGDLVIGERGCELFVLPADPWEEGADVVIVDEEGERLPEASTVAHLALGLVGEAAVMFGDDGEFRDALFEEDGELTAAAQRRIWRRRLDIDPDAPRARLRLAQCLLADGELRGAAGELKQVLRRAPELLWAHETMAKVAEARGDRDGARRSYLRTAQIVDTDDPIRGAYFRAHAARCADGDERLTLVAAVQAARPGFAREQVDAAQALIEREALPLAREVVELGLAISPAQVELLALRSRLDQAQSGPAG